MKKGKLVALNNRSANEWVETNVSCKNVFLRKKKKNYYVRNTLLRNHC